jgi:hypothetical protein
LNAFGSMWVDLRMDPGLRRGDSRWVSASSRRFIACPPVRKGLESCRRLKR